jgi:hypothetical protein
MEDRHMSTRRIRPDDDTSISSSHLELTLATCRPREHRAVAACHLEAGSHHVCLSPGANPVGRDRSATVHIDAASVSRRHARIDLEGDRAVLVDLGSKNGTFARGHRVTEAVELHDGDAIRIADVWLIFRSSLGADDDAAIR